DVYYGIPGAGGKLIFTSNGPVSGTNTLNLKYGPGTSTKITVVIDAGGSTQPATQWYYTALITPTVAAQGGITKVGSQLLSLQGDGTYSGPVDIRQGVLIAQNSTALGLGVSTTTVESGASLCIANGQANTTSGASYNNGGIQTGIQVWGEHLILNGPG